MSHVSKRLLPLALLASALLPACDGKEAGGTSDGGGLEPVRVAVCGPMTGSSAAFGEMIQKAAKLKEREINAAGGVLVDGKRLPLEITIYDDKGDTAEANAVARKVTSNDDVLLVIGHFNSTCTLAAREEYNRKGIVEFTPGSTNVDVCRGAPYTFRNLYRDDFQGRQIADYLKGPIGVASVAVVYEDEDYGKGLMTHFRDRAREIGLEVVATIPYLRERTQDFKPLVQQAKDKGAGAIFVSGLYNDAALITKAARNDLGMDVPIIGGDGVMSETYIRNAGAAAEGAYVTTPFLFDAARDSEDARRFYETFRGEYGKDPDTWAALTWDALAMALESVAAAGRDRKAIRDHLAGRDTEAEGFQGITGLTYFDSEGDCFSKPIYVARVKQGEFVPAEKQIER